MKTVKSLIYKFVSWLFIKNVYNSTNGGGRWTWTYIQYGAAGNLLHILRVRLTDSDTASGGGGGRVIEMFIC